MVADMCGRNVRVLADVGCDHGRLGISLLAEGRALKVIGMDLREGPLSRARENAARSGLKGDRFETRLSDGLDALKPGEADVIVMAGIGGVLMCRLLARGIGVAKKAARLVLSPQSHIESVRELLDAEGFVFIDERMCREGGKYYTVMSVRHESVAPFGVMYRYDKTADRQKRFADADVPGTQPGGNGRYAYTLSDEELFFGPVLIKKGEPLFYDYVRKMRDKAKKRLSEINRKNDRDVIKDGPENLKKSTCAAAGIEPGAAHEEGYDPSEHFERLLASAEKILGKGSESR